jgi:hypothetical protein
MATESVKHGWPSWEDHSINRESEDLFSKVPVDLMCAQGSNGLLQRSGQLYSWPFSASAFHSVGLVYSL